MTIVESEYRIILPMQSYLQDGTLEDIKPPDRGADCK
jgi:hypothetical protein|tara:strand:+ start:90 stop:200 length:111 start_codon:yes stop_codon:yes gene_type:complete